MAPQPAPIEEANEPEEDEEDEEQRVDAALQAAHDLIEPSLTIGNSQVEQTIHFRNSEKAMSAAVRPEDSPRNWKEAMARPDSSKWREAAEAEFNALRDNGTWDLVQLPEGRKAIGSKWVFLIKRNADGSIKRYKARLVGQGFSQVPGRDFDQTYAPTARLAALRTILAQAALAGDHIESIDISNTYLNGDLEPEYELLMDQPEGFYQEGSTGRAGKMNRRGRRWVCRLKKGLYGLKQSGRLWYYKLCTVLEGMGFTQIQSDPSIYVWMKNGVRVILPVFVDDITITSPDQSKIKWVKESLAKIFKLTDLGPISYLLGIKIDYDQKRRVLRLSQKQYILDMLERFKLSDCRPVSTPMEPGLQLTKKQAPETNDHKEYMKNVPYMNAVGALMYLAIGTRPDIAYSVGKLAQFNSNPGVAHWKAVKHLFRYLKGTLDLRLTYRADSSDIALPNTTFTAYSDSDYAGCLDTRRSTSGYALKMGTGAVSWSSKKQSIIALSSTEAEYVAASIAGQEVVWMRQLLQELHFNLDEASPLIMHMDNQSAIAVVNNPEHHGRMKQVDVRHHWIRQFVRKKQLKVYYVPTQDMTADIFTKALPRVLVERHRHALGLM